MSVSQVWCSCSLHAEWILSWLTDINIRRPRLLTWLLLPVKTAGKSELPPSLMSCSPAERQISQLRRCQMKVCSRAPELGPAAPSCSVIAGGKVETQDGTFRIGPRRSFAVACSLWRWLTRPSCWIQKFRICMLTDPHFTLSLRVCPEVGSYFLKIKAYSWSCWVLLDVFWLCLDIGRSDPESCYFPWSWNKFSLQKPLNV